MNQSFPFHGDLEAPDGLLPLAEHLASCPWSIHLARSGNDGALYLKARHDDIEFEMDSGQRRNFHFSGAVDGTREHALQRMSEFSDCLKRAGIVHCVELYEQPPLAGGALVAVFSHELAARQRPKFLENSFLVVSGLLAHAPLYYQLPRWATGLDPTFVHPNWIAQSPFGFVFHMAGVHPLVWIALTVIIFIRMCRNYGWKLPR